MKARQELESFRTDLGTAVTVGVFDGVHHGHQYLIDRLKDVAQAIGCPSAVVTFINHPLSVLKPDIELRMITLPDERISLLKDSGVDFVVPLTFDLEFSYLTARQFIALLQDSLNMKALIVGKDFVMGHNREGTTEVLQKLGEEMGFRLHILDPVDDGGAVISSTLVRNAISDGDIAKATKLLGRYFSLMGKVIKGDQRGRQLGFPTANLEVSELILLPPDGVYVTWAEHKGITTMSATSIGIRPTFGLRERTIESHLIDFSDNLYGDNLSLNFVSRLREERKFDTTDELVAQMALDIMNSRDILGRI